MGGKFRRTVILAVFIIILLLAAILVTVTNIGGNEVGIVEKKFGGGSLAEGRIISVKGENGIQAQVLAPGLALFLLAVAVHDYKNSGYRNKRWASRAGAGSGWPQSAA